MAAFVWPACSRPCSTSPALCDDYAARASYHQIEALTGPPAITGRMAAFTVTPQSFPMADMGWIMAAFTKMLEIKNLHVKLQEEDKQILKGVDLVVGAGEVHAIMGPNGSGKSTLSYVLAGRDGYEVTEGSASLEGADLLAMEPEVRAASGLFLAFQYPVEIPGVGNMTFLRTALNAQRKTRGEAELSAGDFLKLVREKAKSLKIDAEMLKRPVNVGFSGGEKKRNEILQMAMLEPKMCILDETDSGLDVDAMKLVAEGVNALRSTGRSFLVITHYQRLLDHIKPDVVHIMAAGRIIKTGGPELALEVENNGYADLVAADSLSGVQ
jgi:Fe-S cluster assembly ATP-binding protein